MFSIIVPTYNNIEYLKILISSIKKNSKFNHEIIVHVNDSNKVLSVCNENQILI